MSPSDKSRILAAADRVQDLLLSKRNEQGWWTGRLSTSALSTATAVMALHKAVAAAQDAQQRDCWQKLVVGGLKWLAEHQNSDGGWGDTVLSISNISTTMLAHAVFRVNACPHGKERGQAPRRSEPGVKGTSDWRGASPRSLPTPFDTVIESSDEYIRKAGGVPAVIKRYGKDRTFSIPILTHCALAGIVDWKDVMPLPFELACVPHRFYAAVRMPVVSYALPALIAIGQVIFKHRRHWNPVMRLIRHAASQPSLRVLESIQPTHGGFLEATPLTSFVCMSLLGCDLFDHVVTQRCLQFIEASVREDGSWPIDTNLTTWVTTLSVNAMAGEEKDSGFRIRDSGSAGELQPRSGDSSVPEATASGQSSLGGQAPAERQLASASPRLTVTEGSAPAARATGTGLPLLCSYVSRDSNGSVISGAVDSGWALTVRTWLLGQQYRIVHPYTHAAPGGWSWTDLPGGVPDADDTPGAMLALMNLRGPQERLSSEEMASLRAAAVWLLDLQNRDGGWPTFCRGWGTLPFDRSSCDLTAHSLRALHRFLAAVTSEGHEPGAGFRARADLAIRKGLRFLQKVQRPDGTWLPLWFGHQFSERDENPLYGTSRVVRAMSTIGGSETVTCQNAVRWLLENQNDDGGWSARRGLDSSVEETGLALDSLAGFESARSACDRAAEWLAARVDEGTVQNPSPIGFYFARLWYFEDLYPIIFATAGLNRWREYLVNRD